MQVIRYHKQRGSVSHMPSLLSSKCDKSVNEGTRERRTGTRDEERGTRLGNEARETLWPHPNSVTGTGNEDPPCVDMGGTSDPISRCIIIGN